MNMTPKYLWFLMLSYAMVLVIANWFDARLIYFAGITLDAGTLIFPLTFIIADMITEVYGYKHTRRAIWTGFLFNLIFLGYGQLIIHLPSPPYYHDNELFSQLLNFNARIVIASMISYLVAEPINALLLAKWKIAAGGKRMPLRFVSSTAISALFDSIIFLNIAFYGILPSHELWKFVLSLWLAKLLIEIIGLPLSVSLTKWLKRREEIDIYDVNTRFTLFSLEATYTKKDNKA
jgi:queuosine precursor transporter